MNLHAPGVARHVAQFLFFATFCSSLVAAAETADAYRKRPLQYSVSGERIIAGSYAAGDSLARQTKSAEASKAFRASLERINTLYEERRQNHAISTGILRVNNAVVNGLAGIVPVLGEGMALLTGEAETLMQESLANERRRLLRYSIEELRKKDPDVALNPDYLAGRVSALIGPNSPFKNVPATEMDELQSQAILDITQSLDKVLKSQAIDKKNIEALSQGFAKLTGDVSTLKKKTKELEALTQDAREEASRQLQKSTTDADSGRTIERAQTASREFVAKAQKIAVVTAEIGNQFGAAAGVFSALGDTKMAAKMNKVAGIANVVSAFAVASVNPMAILPALGGAASLFGGGQDNGMAAMQEAILAAIRQLAEQIERNHREVMARFDNTDSLIVANQKSLRQLISAAAQQCFDFIPDKWKKNDPDDVFKFDLNLQTSWRFDNYSDLATQVASKTSSIKPCLAGDNSSLNVHFGTVLSLDGFALKRADIETVLGKPEDAKARSQALALLDGSSKLATEFIDKFLRADVLSWLASPSLSERDLSFKMELIGLNRQPAFEPLNPQHDVRLVVRQYYREILNPERVVQLSSYLIATHFLYQLYDVPKGELYSWSQLKAGRGADNTEGLQHLHRANTIIGLALAQQSLVSGDILLPIAYAVVRDDPRLLTEKPLSSLFRSEIKFSKEPVKTENGVVDSWGELKSYVGGYAEKNPLFASNLAAYVVYRDLEFRPSRYAVALEEKGPEVFNLLGASPWTLRYTDPNKQQPGIPTGWSIRLFNMFVPLPTLEQFTDRSLLQTKSLVDLLGIRDRLISEIAGYGLTKDLEDSKDDQALKDVLLAGLEGV